MNLIRRLELLEKNWDNSLELFADGNGLMLVNIETQEVLDTFNIPNDGGDPGTIEIKGKLYLDLPFTVFMAQQREVE